MAQLTNWFGEPITIPATPKLDTNINPCIALYGAGPADKYCSDCSHLVGICKAKTYYKCDLRTNTHGKATDHRRRYPSCGRFEQREGTIRLYDGRS